MKKLAAVTCLCFPALFLACTRHHVTVKADEPFVIKVEARIDIYNHAAEIEDMVSGKQPIAVPDENGTSSFFFDPFASNACAGDVGRLRKAIANRKQRYGLIQELKRRGVAGESAEGFLSIRSRATHDQKMLVRNENEDRQVIYVETARERQVPLQEVQQGFADVLRKRSEAGTWIETKRGWIQK